MMQSDEKEIDQYFDEVPEERVAALKQLRQLCQEELSNYEESMKYGMPSYSKDGIVEVAFASQKSYISLYILKKAVMDKHRPALDGLNLGKGCIRYSKPEKIDFDIVRELLKDSYLSDAEIC